VDKVALGEVFHRVVRFYPVSIIPPLLHIHLHLHVAVIRRTNGRSLGTFQKAMLFRNSETIGKKSTSTFLMFQRFTETTWRREYWSSQLLRQIGNSLPIYRVSTQKVKMWSRGKFFPVHTIKAYRWGRRTLPVTINSASDGREWSTSRPGRFSPRERIRGTR
jgi:hypothetical protein